MTFMNDHRHPIIHFLPVFIGISACFFTDARYYIGDQQYGSALFRNYAGWGSLLLLTVFLAYLVIRYVKKLPVNPKGYFFMGSYLLGHVIFRLYHTLTLYSGAAPESLAQSLKAKAIPGEGLFLLGICGIWLLLRARRDRYNKFSTPVE